MKIEEYLFEVNLTPEVEYKIYAIVDPDTLEVKYIGQTTNTEVRFNSHLREARNTAGTNISSNKKCRQWISHQLENNKTPKFFVLEIVKSENAAKLRENYWIRYYRDESLLNRRVNSFKMPKE